MLIAAALAGINLANHMASQMVGSIKKNHKNISTNNMSASSPSSTSYNTLPSHRHLRAQQQGRTPSPKQYVSPTNPNSGISDGIQATPPMGGGMSHAHTLGRLRNKRGSPGSGGGRNAMSYHPLLLSDLEANQQFRANMGSGMMGKSSSSSKVQHHTVYLHGKPMFLFQCQ